MGKLKLPLGWSDVGSFEVKAPGRIGVWDPCYGYDKEFEAVPGKWIGQVEISDERDWGHRVKRLSAKLEGHQFEGQKFQRLGVVGVDSGQMGIYGLSDWDGGLDTAEDQYDKICDITLKGQAGTLPYGVVSSSGYGDGGYYVYGRKDSAGRLVEVLVDFIPDVHSGDCLGCGEASDELGDEDHLCPDCQDKAISDTEA